MSSDTQAMPLGWELVTIEGIAESIQYGHTASAVDQDTGPRFLRITDIQDGKVDWATVPSCNLTDDELPKYQLKPGDLVFARTGATTGKSFLIRDCPEAVFASYLIRVRVSTEMDERFLALFFQSPDYWRQIEGGKRGVGQPNVNGTILGQVQFSLPPVAEQRRIVAKIEELFSELDEGVANLKKARAQLAVYRQALLKHAFEGRLTADWRAQHTDQLESAEQLLARVRELADGFNPSREDLIAALPPLPSSWVYTYLSNLGELGRGKSKHRPRNDPSLFGGPYPFLQTGEVKAANGIIRSYQQTYSEVGLRQSKLWPSGTLCITIAANIAETAFLGFDACFPDSVVGFTPNKGAVISEFVELFIRSAKTRIAAYAPATAQKNINLETLENLLVPLPTYDEQKEIVSTLGAQLSVLDALEADIDLNLQKAEALRQSILKKAFAGELVPQDPADEPASELLARIRAEREAVAAVAKPEKPRKARKP